MLSYLVNAWLKRRSRGGGQSGDHGNGHVKHPKLSFAALVVAMLPGTALAQGYCPAYSTAARVITTLPYTVGSGDYCSLLIFNPPQSLGVVTLPVPGTAFVPTGYTMQIKNGSASSSFSLAVQQNPLTFYTPLLDMASTMPTIPPGGTFELFNNGTDWFTSSGFNTGAGPLFVTGLTLNSPALGFTTGLTLDTSGNLRYTSPAFAGQTLYVAVTNPSTNLSLTQTRFATAPSFVNGACTNAPIGAKGNGPQEWLVLTDPLGYTHSIPMC